MGQWVLPEVPGLGPGPRGGHACASLGSKLIVFGGSDRAPVTYDDLWVLDTSKGAAGLEWTRVTPSFTAGCSIHPRSGATLTAVGELLYLFGGQEPLTEFRFGDLKVLDTNTWTWSDVEIKSSSSPPARHSHSACCLASQCLLVYGGSGIKQGQTCILSDVWIFNPLQGAWQQPQIHGSAPQGREMHCAAMVSPTRMMIYGGRGEDQGVLCDAAVLDVNDMRWIVSEPTCFPRCAHSCAALPMQLPSHDQGAQHTSGTENGVTVLKTNGTATPAQPHMCMVIHGGFSGEAVEGDVLCIDGQTLEVEVLHKGPRQSDVQGTVPPVRFGAAAAPLLQYPGGPVMCLFGGVNPEQDLNDVCIWELQGDK